jgi:hypothetical protein
MLQKNTHVSDKHGKKLPETIIFLKWTVFKLCHSAHLFPNTPRTHLTLIFSLATYFDQILTWLFTDRVDHTPGITHQVNNLIKVNSLNKVNRQKMWIHWNNSVSI